MQIFRIESHAWKQVQPYLQDQLVGNAVAVAYFNIGESKHTISMFSIAWEFVYQKSIEVSEKIMAHIIVEYIRSALHALHFLADPVFPVLWVMVGLCNFSQKPSSSSKEKPSSSIHPRSSGWLGQNLLARRWSEVWDIRARAQYFPVVIWFCH